MKIVLMIICAGTALCSSFSSEVYPNYEDPVERLIYAQPNQYWSEDRLREWKAAIVALPGAKKRLFDLFIRDFKEAKDWELVSCPLAALSLRQDVTSDDLKIIDQEMLLIVNGAARTQLGNSVLAGAVGLLSKHPTPERETLMIRLTHDADWMVALASLRSLVAANSRFAKDALDAAIKRRTIPGRDQSLDWMLADMQKLRASVLTPPVQINNNRPFSPPRPDSEPIQDANKLKSKAPSEEPTASLGKSQHQAESRKSSGADP